MPQIPIIIKMSPWSDKHEPCIKPRALVKPARSPFEVNYEAHIENFLNRCGIYLFLTLLAGIIAILEFILLK